jgi:chromosomal replication initiation ATPase DnaA
MNTQTTLTVGAIITFVEERYRLPAGTIASPARREAFCRARQVATWLCRQLTPATFKEIAAVMGGRHGPAIQASLQAAEDRIDVEKGFATEVQGLKERLMS